MVSPRRIQKTLWLSMVVVALLLIASCGSNDLSDSVVNVPLDIHGDSISTATVITVPYSTTTQLDRLGDVDFFGVPMQADTSYGFETNLGTLLGTTLTLLDQFGQEFAFSENFNGLASRIEFTPTTSLTMYLQVAGLGANIGSYDLVVKTFIPKPVQIEKVIALPLGLSDAEIPDFSDLAITHAQIGTPIVVIGTGFSSMLKWNSVWLGGGLLPVKSVGPGFLVVIAGGGASPDVQQLTVETDHGLDSIGFILETPTP